MKRSMLPSSMHIVDTGLSKPGVPYFEVLLVRLRQLAPCSLQLLARHLPHLALPRSFRAALSRKDADPAGLTPRKLKNIWAKPFFIPEQCYYYW